MQEKFDITTLYPKLYKATKKPTLVTVPALRILAVSGEGDPMGPAFQDSVAAIYATIYAIKFMPRKGVIIDNYIDFKVPPLETLWSMKNGKEFDINKKDQWLWEVFLVVPGFVTQPIIKKAISLVEENKPNPRYQEIHINTLQEKQAVQILHQGAYEKEANSIELMQRFISRRKLKSSGRHHEIYLNNPSRVTKARLKTILRQPVVSL